MSNFDLNIDNYTRDELIEMFKLPQTFDKNILEINEAKLRESIINNKQINQATQVKTLNFLTKAKNIIFKNFFLKRYFFRKNILSQKKATYHKHRP